MTTKLLPPMRLFALRILVRDGIVTPTSLRIWWRAFQENNGRMMSHGASQRTFGQISNSYKTCRWLEKNEFCRHNHEGLYTTAGLRIELRERLDAILRAQELLESKKNGNPLTPFGEETLRLIQQKYETR